MYEFSLTDEQREKAEKWMDEKKKYVGANGGQFSFVFTPTKIGMIVKVKDDSDNTELDLTDFSLWS